MDNLVNKRIAIIPARGGSKRIPGKNIINFLGKPMIASTIEAARESGCFDRILVSTDDPETAETAQEFGAEAPFLRENNADDHSPVSEATWHALNQAMSYWGESYNTVVQLMANCPLRDSEDIKNCVKAFDSHKRTFQISCFRFGWMNPWWATKLDGEGRPTQLFPEAAVQRSQDLPDLFCPTGAVWIAQAKQFLESRTFYGEDNRFEPLSWKSAIDIDDQDDLEFALAVAQHHET